MVCPFREPDPCYHRGAEARRRREKLVELAAEQVERSLDSPVIFEGEGFLLRLATGNDQATLSALVDSIPFGGLTPVHEGRGDDFFALRRLQSAQFGEAPMTFLIQATSGEAIGCLTVVVRPARIGSQALRVGEICDIRVAPGSRGGTIFPRVLKTALDYVSSWYDIEVFRTAVLGDDFRCLWPRLRRNERRYEQPMAQVMSRMDVVWLPLNLRWLPRLSRHVQRAKELDREELVAFLLKSESTRRMGVSLTPAQLSRRFATWPTFGVENFQLVRGASGQIVGCGAPWNPESLRTFRLGQPSLGAKLARARFDWRARLTGLGALPKPNVDLAPLLITHMEVADDDPGILRDLLVGILRDLEPTHQKGLLFAVPKTGAFDRALNGLPTYRLPLSLLAITPAGTPWNNTDFRARRSGFELAFL